VADWDWVVEGAERHGVLPLINRWAAARPTMVPAAIVERIGLSARIQAMQSLMLAGEMVTLSQRLERAGISVMTLKGAPLAVLAYGDLALRPQNDVDLLVHRHDVDRAIVELAAAGYEREHELAPGQDAAFRDVEYHHKLRSAAGTSVELHWGIIKRQFGLRVDESSWWAKTQRVRVGGAEVVTLSNELMLVYLAIHGGKHEWPHLRWIGDIAAVARLEAMDWEAVREVSTSLGTLRMTRLALALASSIAGAKLPAGAEKLANGDPAVPPLASEIRRRLERGTEEPGFVESTTFQLALRERRRDRAAFVMLRAITPNTSDLEVADLPAEWRGVYHVLRPLRLLGKWMGLADPRRAQ
jgi:hypothetical protein